MDPVEKLDDIMEKIQQFRRWDGDGGDAAISIEVILTELINDIRPELQSFWKEVRMKSSIYQP